MHLKNNSIQESKKMNIQNWYLKNSHNFKNVNAIFLLRFFYCFIKLSEDYKELSIEVLELSKHFFVL